MKYVARLLGDLLFVAVMVFLAYRLGIYVGVHGSVHR